jgi:3-hydroxymyristoyl/3-hydroxydecanoyl-(acyl carrier protein) dehydratase
LLLEAGAQLAGVVGQSDPAIPPLAELKLAGVRAVKITGTARPGETIRIEAYLLGRLGQLIHARASASVKGVVVMTAEMTLAGNSS